jgi:hypothetical protein
MKQQPPPRPGIEPDLTRPCVRCALHHKPWLLARLFLGAHKDECLSEDVRGYTLDPVAGLARLNMPISCEEARAFGGKCGPDGRQFAFSNERRWR